MAYAEKPVTYHSYGKGQNVTTQFFVELLQLSLSKSTDYQSRPTRAFVSETTTQGRLLALLESGEIDVIWIGTRQQREKRFLPVRIPLMKGLLGNHIFIVHKDNYNALSTLSASQLKAKVTCQGAHWPDSDILEHNPKNLSQKLLRTLPA